MAFRTLIALLLVVLSFAFATGVVACADIGPDHRRQALLIVHGLTGALAGLLIAAALRLHPVQLSEVPRVRLAVALAGGLAAFAAAALALLSGFWMAAIGNLSAHPAVAASHRVAGSLLVSIAIVHCLVSWRHRGRALPAAAVRGLAWAPVAGLLIAVGAVAPSRLLAPPAATKPVPPRYVTLGAEPKTLFTPGLQKTAHGALLTASALAGSRSCGSAGCHVQIVDEWNASAHRHAARNDHYRAQVKLRIHDVPVKPHAGARFCGACHEPVAALSGEIDPTGRGIDFAENLDEGISCLTCHRQVDVHETSGNAAYTIEAPNRRLGEGMSGLAGLVGDAALRASPLRHRQELMRPLLRESRTCAPCHRLTVGRGINPTATFFVQETYDEWRFSRYAQSQDPAERRRCQDCHMPLVPSTDPAAKAGKHRSHRFLGANTMRPFLDGDTEQLRLTQAFLTSGAIRMTARADVSSARDSVSLTVAVSNVGVGHRFPTGTVDMNEVWIEVIATDASGARVFASGLIDPRTLHVDPEAEFYRSVPRDRDGAWLYRRDVWNAASFLPFPERGFPGATNRATMTPLERGESNLFTWRTMRTIWPGTTDHRSYVLPLAGSVRFPLRIATRLRYRKSNQRFTDWVFDPRPLREGSGYVGPHGKGLALPVTDVAAATVTVEDR